MVLTLAILGAVGVHWQGSPLTGATGRGVPGVARLPSPSVAGGGTGVRFSFDGGLAALNQVGPGQLALAVRAAEGGHLTGVPHGSGTALAFPAPCARYGAADCPRAVLEVLDSGGLSPARRSVRWGASLLLAADQATPGSNVLQKGVSTGGGQYKLQVDGPAGRPSCVLAGSVPDSPIYVVKSTVSVADARWHTVACTRLGPSLTVVVDGLTAGQVSVPDDLSVANSDTLRIGGKGTSPNNDQFSGVLDDVFVDIGS